MAQENVTALPNRAPDNKAASTEAVSKNETAKSADASKVKPAEKSAVAKKAKSSAKKTTAKKPVKKAAKKTVSKSSKTAKKAISANKKTVQKAVKTQAKAAKKIVSTSAQASQKATNQAFANPANLNPMMEKMMYQGKSQFDKLAQDAAEMNRENIEAVVKCSSIFAKGFEDIMRLSMSMAQDAAERQSKFMKDVLSSKTLNEFTEVQNRVAQVNFDEFVNGATKITEMSMKVMTDSLEPLNQQMNKGIKKASQKMAA
jgi:phasin family protein